MRQPARLGQAVFITTIKHNSYSIRKSAFETRPEAFFEVQLRF
jgi:hypothetical protein